MIDSKKVLEYRMRNTSKLPNVKDIIGKTVTPVHVLEAEYTDTDGEVHSVMSVDFGSDGIYRTEVGAFIEEMRNYWAVFGEDEEKPAIIIIGKQSKRGNSFVSFDVTGI